MLIEIKDKVVSTELFQKNFVCDLNACKGACCVEGDSGAPLTFDEVDIIEEILDDVKPYMRPEGLVEVERNGVFYMDFENEPVTALINGGECAFVYFDEKRITKCAIEKAYLEGKTDFKKPVSCHLYPIREKKFSEITALDYNKWSICDPACQLGDELKIPVYKFLKEPIIRAYGEEFYAELEVVDEELKNSEL